MDRITPAPASNSRMSEVAVPPTRLSASVVVGGSIGPAEIPSTSPPVVGPPVIPETTAVAPVLHKDSSFAFRVAPAGDSSAPGLVYSGDCGRADDLLALIRPGDTLLVEASHGAGPIIEGPNHLNVAEVVRVATAGRVGRVVLTHFLDDVDPQAALELARSTFAGESLVAEPGLRLAI